MSKKLIDRKVEYCVIPVTYNDEEYSQFHEWFDTFKECKKYLKLLWNINHDFTSLRVREYITRDYDDHSREIHASGFDHTIYVEDVINKLNFVRKNND